MSFLSSVPSVGSSLTTEPQAVELDKGLLQLSQNTLTNAAQTLNTVKDSLLQDASYSLEENNSDIKFIAEAKLSGLNIEDFVFKKCKIPNYKLKIWKQNDFTNEEKTFTDDELEALKKLEISNKTTIPILQQIYLYQIEDKAIKELIKQYETSVKSNEVFSFKEYLKLEFFNEYKEIFFDKDSGEITSQRLLSYCCYYNILHSLKFFSSKALKKYIKTEEGLKTVLLILELDPKVYQRFPDEFKKNNNVLDAALKFDMSNYNFLPENLKNRIFLNEFIFNHPEVLMQDNEIISSWRLLYSTVRFINQKINVPEIKINNLSQQEIKIRMLQGAKRLKLPDYKQVDEVSYNEFLKCISDGNYKNIRFKQNYSALALKALIEDKITASQFSTLMVYESVFINNLEQEIEIIPLFLEDGFPNVEALDAICQTMTKKDGTLHIKAMQLVKFFDLMKKAPHSEQYFFKIPANILYNGENTVVAKIGLTKVDVNVFAFYEGIRQEKLRMVPSCYMKQAFLNAVFEQDAVTILPKIGLSTEEEILENAFDATRDEAIPLERYVSLPKKADDFPAPTAYDFNAHDTYHAIICSNIPDQHRKITGHTLKRFKQEIVDKFSDKDLSQISAKIANLLIDMEFSNYKLIKNEEKTIFKLVEAFNYTIAYKLKYYIYVKEIPSQEAEKNKTQKFLEATIVQDLAKIFIEVSKDFNKFNELKSCLEKFKFEEQKSKFKENGPFSDIIYPKTSFLMNIIELLEKESD